MQSRARRLTTGVGRQRGGRRSGTSRPARPRRRHVGVGAAGGGGPALVPRWIPGAWRSGGRLRGGCLPDGAGAWVGAWKSGLGVGRAAASPSRERGLAESGNGGGGREPETASVGTGERRGLTGGCARLA